MSVPFEAEAANVWSCAATDTGNGSPSTPSAETERAKTTPPVPMLFSSVAMRGQATMAMPFAAATLGASGAFSLSGGVGVIDRSRAEMRMTFTADPSR